MKQLVYEKVNSKLGFPQQSTEEDPDEGVKELVETALKKLVSSLVRIVIM